MSITQHPSDSTLLEFASGTLDEGRSVVVAAHLQFCTRCSRLIGKLQTAGGVLLDDLPPAALADDALARALARTKNPAPTSPLRSSRQIPSDLPMLPVSAHAYSMGQWRWMGPGVHWRSIDVPADRGARVFLLKAAPGTKMPHHTHTGTELTLVLSGSFSHIGGNYGPGDLDEADDSVEHQPIVAPGEDCICLVAMEGQLRLLGVVGRLLQPFVRL